ncbi:MAG: AMP-dependent synthetase/ligase [Anaerovoracaceae bacterium]|jgi:long-chain acyl-CoA synthetase
MASNKKYKNAYYPIRTVTDLKDMINSSARLFGDSPAYLIKNVPGGKYVPKSYNQLKDDIDAFGTALISMGLKGKHIAVIGETRYEWMVADLGIANGVGVTVPLDRELPESELTNLAQRAHLSAIVYSAKVEKRLFKALENVEGLEYRISMDAESSGDGIISMKELIKKGRSLIKAGNTQYLDAKIDPDAMSILLYTSGTTGLAKGVMLTHKNIVSEVMNMSMYVHVRRDDISLSVLPIHHTYEFTCNHMTVLFQGGILAICEGLKHIVTNMNECHATIMLGVPQIFEVMHNKIMKQAEKAGKAEKLKKGMQIAKTLSKFNINVQKRMFKDVHNAFGGRMRMFINGAAALDPDIIDDFNIMGINTFQGYGLTENSPIVAVFRDRYHHGSSVGPAMPNTEIRIIDPDEDGIGEVAAKDDSVMLGYYEDPEATAEVLKDGWLYTGDYGYIDDENFLHITGRKKNVIVTKNGKNIFPEEVEYYLMKNKYISEVIVTGEPDEKTGNLLVTAHIVPDQEALEDDQVDMREEELRKFFKKQIDDVNDQMSSYKRVKRFEIRKEEFEKTSTRKIKRFGKNIGESEAKGK